MGTLQFISHQNERFSYIDSIKIALDGGCRWVQLRMKDSDDDTVKATALEVLPLCRKLGATLIIDDRVEVVKEVGADGVHLGKNDMPVAEARKILGSSFIIGGTANTARDVLDLWQAGADYIGCGPFRFTQTKKNLSPILGLDGYRNIVQTVRKAGCELPIVAIGGIKFEDIPDIMDTGVNGIALSSSILNAEEPVEEMKRILVQVSGDRCQVSGYRYHRGNNQKNA